jgi:dTDP-4-dehydrorhamnose reductase
MRILILGGDGMLGHELLRSLAPGHDVRVTLRQPLAAYRHLDGVSDQNATGGVDARDWARLADVIGRSAPEALINCIGIVKQRKDAKSPIPSLEINSLLPHRLNELCGQLGARLVHFSTDCVFSGRRGRYTESDEPDPVDLYGRTKLLGEVDEAPGVTLRTSIIGLEEREHTTGLIEWFLAQRGKIKGFRKAIYTGLTTAAMARLVALVLEQHAGLHGLWQVASEPITKHDLLVDLAKKLGRSDIEIVPDDEFFCDRSLEAGAFFRATGYRAPAWGAMLTELAAQIRAKRVSRSYG